MEKQKELTLWKRWVLLILVAVFYFLAIRPVRESINSLQVRNIELPESVLETVQFEVFPTSIGFWYQIGENKVVEGGYKIPFGRYFLLALATIILLNLPFKSVFSLVFIHAVGLVVLAITFHAGIYLYKPLLLVTDLLSKYMIPLASFGTVVIGFFHKKNAWQSS